MYYKMSFIFNEKYTYPFNEILKKYQGKFNPETKQWAVPLQNKKLFMQEKDLIQRQQQELARLAWGSSCDELGYKFVKRETPEYLEVKELFKLKMKELK